MICLVVGFYYSYYYAATKIIGVAVMELVCTNAEEIVTIMTILDADVAEKQEIVHQDLHHQFRLHVDAMTILYSQDLLVASKVRTLVDANAKRNKCERRR